MSDDELRVPQEYLDALAVSYTFKEQLAIGEKYERVIDDYLRSLGVEPQPVPLHLQREGIDRIVQNGDMRNTAEYKADKRAGDTGRLFLETELSEVDGTKTLGWPCKSSAQVVLTIIPDKNLLLWADMWRVKMFLPKWVAEFGLTKWVDNVRKDGKHFQARGVAVPIKVYEKRVVFRMDVINGEAR